MRGQVDPQATMLHYFSAESRVPADHPLRRVKQLAERALDAISGELDALYSTTGRPSIAPEHLLKGQLLIALYSIRSDRQFCEQLDYNILFRWFLDMGLESDGLDQSNFSRLRERLVAIDIARRFFDEVVRLARRQQLLSSDHFTVDGTLMRHGPRSKVSNARAVSRRRQGTTGPGWSISKARSGRIRPIGAPPIRTPGSCARATASRPN